MADPRYLKVINKGAHAWNQWRQNEPFDYRLDLSGVHLSGADISGADLHGVVLHRADLTGQTIIGANLEGADLTGAVLLSVTFKDTNLRSAVFNHAFLNNVKAPGHDLSNTDLTCANLVGADLRGADLTHASLPSADLSHADLTGAVFDSADLDAAHLYRATLSDARLTWSSLQATSITETEMRNTDLSHVVFNNTTLGNIDLTTVVGLDRIVHRGPSSIGIDTLMRSGGLPDAFLRGVGISDTVLAFVKASRRAPIEFYSCFISYSAQDEALARRIYADCQIAGVRCWFAPEDLKIGDKFRAKIDESIRLYDKLLLILSAASIESAWVEEEVEIALEKERAQKRAVLFPIRVDDAIDRTQRAWATSLRRSRHIAAFDRWTEIDSYQQGLDRLLRDLKA